jgi:beta-aspartyl-dipeptidase (metallo-type)
VALAERGCTVDVTAFPVADGEDAWCADEALVRYWASGAPPERVTVSSDGGGCLPAFDADGRVTHMDVGDATGLADALAALVARGVPLERAVAPFTANPAALLRLPGKGVLAVGADADLVVLDARARPRDVMARGRWHVRDGRVVRRGTFEGPWARVAVTAVTAASVGVRGATGAEVVDGASDGEVARNLP